MSSATATATSAHQVAPVCQNGGQPSPYLIGFRIAINGYIVLNIYYNSGAPHLMIIESIQLGTRQVLSHYESPLETIRRLYQCTPQQLPQLNTAFVTPYENQTWYELLDTYGPMFIGIENPIFQQARASAQAVASAQASAQASSAAPQTPPPRTLTVPLPGAPIRVQLETNRPLHLRSIRRNLIEDLNALIPRKRTFTFMFEEDGEQDQEDQETLEEEREDQDEEEEEDPQEPTDYLELRSGTRIAKY